VETLLRKKLEANSEAFFIKHEAWMWKQLNFCVSGSTLKKEARNESKLGSD